ncbi:hypothetical protein [Paenibacillus cremeus]|uniref:Uncharacterized protein n=1 Tax=Paenibacillus cremeus TaxID=2163881 RepID=A0A559K9K1_9BACL|nr:hypothetical protein [Paenibacillus cremeus]TVY08804.1 hypothetical protein FPZ49_17290 [Paenibacillus cremeus]
MGKHNERRDGYAITGESYEQEDETVSYVWIVETDLKFKVNTIDCDVKTRQFAKTLKKYIRTTKTKDIIRHLLSDEPFFK